jgi:TATA-binding protein-associated factor Taf7
MNPFDFLNSITYNKQDLIVDDETEKGYNAFLVNRGLSYFQDTVLLANEMNRNHHLDGKLQYDFLRGIVRKRKRFSKWAKKEKVEKIDVIKEYYGYSDAKAESVSDLISPEQLDYMRSKLSKGGI